jgi:hypothetical protein
MAGRRPPALTNRKCRHAAFESGIGKLLDVRVGELVMRAMWRRLANGTVLLLGLALQCGSLSAATYQIVIERRAVNIPGRERVGMLINGQLPGPVLRLKEGEDAVIHVTNRLDENASIHWHGLIVSREMDGVPGISPDYGDGIRPGETFTYRFKVRQAGTYWFHRHSMMQIKLWGISRTDGDRPWHPLHRSAVLVPAGPLDVVERVRPVVQEALADLHMFLAGDRIGDHLEVHHVVAQGSLMVLGAIARGRGGMEESGNASERSVVAAGAVARATRGAGRDCRDTRRSPGRGRGPARVQRLPA